jgi:hypothetical protein
MGKEGRPRVAKETGWSETVAHMRIFDIRAANHKLQHYNYNHMLLIQSYCLAYEDYWLHYLLMFMIEAFS